MTLEQLIQKSPIINLVGKEVTDPEVVAFLDMLKDRCPGMLTHLPDEEDVLTSNDKWVCHDAEAQGIIVDLQDQWVASISYTMGACQGIDPLFDECFKGIKSREELRALLGKPLQHHNTADQYQPEGDIIVGAVYYTLSMDELTTVAFGTRRVFTSPELYPNRWSVIFDALYALPG